jgi:thiol-disulfide isomerase/thioredoxin
MKKAALAPRLSIAYGALTVALLLAMGSSSMMGGQQLGIRNRPAPPWPVDAWLNLPEGVDRINIGDFRGQLVYLYFFQSWCPGCHSHGFPTLREVHDHYRENDSVVFVAIQTTFEGYGTNTPERALQSVSDYGLEIPVGHTEGKGEHAGPPGMMRTYRTGGTPWTVIIDREGLVRFDGFSIEAPRAVELIEELLASTG